MRHNRRDDGQLSCRKKEMKTMNANTALDGHTTVIKMAERGGVPLKFVEKMSIFNRIYCANIVTKRSSQHLQGLFCSKTFNRTSRANFVTGGTRTTQSERP